jgi:hypothetical protein
VRIKQETWLYEFKERVSPLRVSLPEGVGILFRVLVGGRVQGVFPSAVHVCGHQCQYFDFIRQYYRVDLPVGYFVLASSMDSLVRAIFVPTVDPVVVVVCNKYPDGILF